jgi:hypothetical protein
MQINLSITTIIFTYPEKTTMMRKALQLLILSSAILIIAPSCNHNKIACPTYADSFPEAKKSKKPDDPQAMPKASKSNVSHSMAHGK